PVSRAGSPSIDAPDYWWYRVRSDLLRTVMEPYLGDRGRILDVGSADGPSVGWLRGRGHRVALDIDPRGLENGDVCGSALALPFANCSFDVVAAFDVIEHCSPEETALAEIHRVLMPGGRFLMSVPAYEWAWTWFDDHNHHHRRYTRKRATAALEQAGFEVLRATYAFAGTFPLFAADRLRTRVKQRGRPAPTLGRGQVPALPAARGVIEQVLLRGSVLDARLLRRGDLPVGSSVFVACRKPGGLLDG
ncbi:MAG: putative S-adenosylmethionine-dependent methyltransferase, partial [Nocardioides sp.]|nr:putative S-adenosylmethionine-dependent methyltransferase [Nocardioides sp.]